jgi:hypothetical protein
MDESEQVFSSKGGFCSDSRETVVVVVDDEEYEVTVSYE